MSKKGMHTFTPADNWEKAFPGGNGKTGILVFGNPADEKIVVNHEDLFLPMHGRVKLPEMAAYLPEIRQLIQNGKQREAAKLFVEKSLEQGLQGVGPDYFHPAFDIRISMQSEKISDYRQSLDFSTGETTTTWKASNTNLTRKTFVSYTDDIIVTSIKSHTKPIAECTLWLSESGMGTEDEEKYLNEYVQNSDFTSSKNYLTFKCNYRKGGGYSGCAKVISLNGTLSSDQGKIVVKDATEILVVTKVNPKLNIEKLKLEVSKHTPNFDELFKCHTSTFKPLFERTSFNLDSANGCSLSNEELIKQGRDTGMSQALAERMHDYGRYLLLCSSGKLPPNAQGIWNGTWKISNLVDYVTNIELEMATWPALQGALPECLEGYFDFIESLVSDWRDNAKKLYGCRGILASSRSSNHGQLHHFSEEYPHEFWTAGAAWMIQTFYDYWQYTGDNDFLLNRALPLMKEAALFYEDFLIDDNNGKLQFIPSVSPENNPGNTNSQAARNATMDIAITRELFTNLISVSQDLGVEHENIERWQNLLNRLPDYQLNADGSIREWVAPELEENYPHRHVSHLYPAYPGLEAEENTLVKEGCIKAIEMRLKNGLMRRCGWSLGHTVNTAARLKDGNMVYKFLSEIATYFVHSNLFTLLDSDLGMFQVDANLGFTAAVMEALVFSQPGKIELLPALPPQWTKGNIAGICCRGNAKVKHLEWNTESGAVSVTLSSPIDQQIELKLAGKVHGIIELKSNQELELSLTI